MTQKPGSPGSAAITSHLAATDEGRWGNKEKKMKYEGLKLDHKGRVDADFRDVESLEEEISYLNFGGKCFSGCNFSDCTFSHVSFFETGFSNCKFDNCNFSHCTFKKAEGKGNVFNSCHAIDCDWTDSRIFGTECFSDGLEIRSAHPGFGSPSRGAFTPPENRRPIK